MGIPRITATLLLGLFVSLIDGGAHSQTNQSHPPKKIILIVSKGDSADFDELRDVINFHVEDLETNIEIVITHKNSQNILEQVEIIRSLLNTTEAFSAIWIENTKQEVFLFVSNKNSDKIFLNTIPFEEGGWVAKCDTIAVLVRSALITWLDTTGQGSESEPSEPIETQTDNVPAQTKEDTMTKPTSTFFFDTGYSLGLLHTRESPVHGMHLGLGLLLGKHLEIRATTRLFQKVKLPITNMDVEFRKIPTTISVGARLSINRHELGLHAGLIVDATYIKGIAASQTKDETSLVHVGFTPSITYRISLLSFMSVWMDVGPEFYFHSYYYTWQGQRVLDYSAVQGRASIGLVFLLSGN